jgi:hypothetical protein
MPTRLAGVVDPDVARQSGPKWRGRPGGGLGRVASAVGLESDGSRTFVADEVRDSAESGTGRRGTTPQCNSSAITVQTQDEEKRNRRSCVYRPTGSAGNRCTTKAGPHVTLPYISFPHITHLTVVLYVLTSHRYRQPVVAPSALLVNNLLDSPDAPRKPRTGQTRQSPTGAAVGSEIASLIGRGRTEEDGGCNDEAWRARPWGNTRRRDNPQLTAGGRSTDSLACIRCLDYSTLPKGSRDVI